MNILIVHDSKYGNTAKIAEALADAVPDTDSVQTLHVKHASVARLQGIDLLVVGSPTRGGRATPEIQEFVSAMPYGALRGISIAAFDTRFSYESQKRPMRFLLRTIGYASNKIARALKMRGGTLIAPPKGFIVDGTEGPLRQGEEEAAADWMHAILNSFALKL